MATRIDVLEELRARYREPHRHYHTLSHVEELLALLDGVRAQVDRPSRLEWAIWFHDAVYDPQRHDNEARSAELARSMLPLASLAREDIEAVAALVTATAGHKWTDGERDTALFLDLDLSILGAPTQRYDAYVAQVRAEYAHVPAQLFTAKRCELLQSWLARPALYFSELGRVRFEERARANIVRELAASARA
jgi:predicted metal-dependent HD superfamily phosphohydrolase